MICHNHSDHPAIAMCVNCGVGLCATCAQKTAKSKIVCSSECGKSASDFDNAIALIVARSQKTSRATAWFCWLLGAIFAALGVVSLFGADKFFAGYLLTTGTVFIFVGVWFGRIAKKTSNPDVQATPASGRG